MSDNAISVKNVSKSFKLPHNKKNTIKSVIVNPFKRTTYEKQEALKNISFDIKKGEFFGIVGRNGSGKSTLLKLIAGIYSPNEGSIKVNGKLTPFIELGVGFNPELSGRENVFLNGALLGFSRKEMQVMYDDIVEFAELEKFMDQKLKNYSSGMQVRLAFSIAIRANSDILLLDEVLAVGDAVFQQKCYKYFKQLKLNNKTVIFVSHDMGAVKQFCTSGIYIKNGQIQASGSVDNIVDSYNEEMLERINKQQQKESLNNEKDEPKLTKNITIEKVEFLDKEDSKKKSFDKNEDIVIEITYKTHIRTENPIFGINIFNSQDLVNPVFAVNSAQPEKLLKDTVFDKNDLAKLRVVVNNQFTNGSYLITPAVADENATVIYDKINHVKAFNSKKTLNNFALFQSKYRASVTRGSNE